MKFVVWFSLFGPRIRMSRVDRLITCGGEYLDRCCFAPVLDYGVPLRTRCDPCSVSFSDDHDLKGPALEHAGVLTTTISDRDPSSFLVPMDRNHRIAATLIVVIVAIVFVEIEVSIG